MVYTFEDTLHKTWYFVPDSFRKICWEPGDADCVEALLRLYLHVRWADLTQTASCP